jgi:hypothetical protein
VLDEPQATFTLTGESIEPPVEALLQLRSRLKIAARYASPAASTASLAPVLRSTMTAAHTTAAPALRSAATAVNTEAPVALV